MGNNWSMRSAIKVLEQFASSERGLDAQEAKRRLQEYGPNKLPAGKTSSLALIFLRQFQSPLIYILFIASLIVFAIGEVTDGSIILFV
ncbi:MAG: hypothetical protein HYW00_01955, partial [Candidatus Colwellbacteria bacterium]|nr:hypothetical protein [Candidatus Colwellbacteria bacterium]